jgi:Leucine-rich repeat (LRR) protein
VEIDLAVTGPSPEPCLSCPVQNQFDSIDLTDNAIVRLEGFPKLPRLKMLLLSNNRIVRIAPHLEGETGCTALLLLKEQQAAPVWVRTKG